MEENQTPEQTNTNTGAGDTPSAEELLADLKQKADTLGVSYSPNIGYATLLKKVQEASVPATSTTTLTVPVNEYTGLKTPEGIEAENRLNLQRNMSKLVRCIITSNDPAMREHDTTPFYAVSNSAVTLPKQTFPLNVEWHVPQAYVDYMLSMKCGIPVKSKDEKGRTITVRKSISKYNINILPPLTQDELDSLKTAQIMRDGL